MWVKLYTKMLNWEWYSDKNTKILFIHCLLKANYKDKEWQGILIKRGSFVTGRKKLAEETGLTEQQVRTSLKRLKATNEITIKTTKKYSIISIVNYEMYQQNSQDNNQQLTNNQPTTNQQLTTTSEYTDNTEYIENNIYYYLEKNFGRPITPAEYQKLANWQEWFSDDIIKYAIDETILKNIRALSYTEAIINAWHDKGYKTLEECKKEKQVLKNKHEPVKEMFDYDWLNED